MRSIHHIYKTIVSVAITYWVMWSTIVYRISNIQEALVLDVEMIMTI